MNPKRIIYLTIVAGAIIYGIAIHFTGILEGLLPAGGQEQFFFEYGAVAATLLLVFLAVRMIKTNIVARMAMLEAATLLDLTGWGIFPEAKSFFYLAIVCLISFVFVFPKKEQE